MAKYRRKPVVIEAEQFVCPDSQVFEPGAMFMEYPVQRDEFGYFLLIPTLEDSSSPHRASVGDWIITRVKGERYPCKPDIFAVTYDPA